MYLLDQYGLLLQIEDDTQKLNLHLKALLCWLLSKWCRWTQELLLPGTTRTICMKFKDQMVGQHWKVLESANRSSKSCNLLPLKWLQKKT